MSILPHRAAADDRPASPIVRDARVLDCRTPCDACGAAIPLIEGGLTVCEYCGAQRVAGATHGVSLLVPFGCSPEQALLEIKRWLRREGHRATQMGRVTPLLVPYWRIARHSLAWPSRHTDPDSRSFEARVDDIEHVELAIEACPAIGAGLPFDDRTLAVFPLDRSLVADAVGIAAVTREPSLWVGETDGAASAVSARGLADDDLDLRGPVLDAFGGSIRDDDDVRMVELDRSVALLYVPFYTLRFTFRKAHHSVLCCGRSGRVTGMLEGEFRQVYPIAERETVFRSAGLPAMASLSCPDCASALRAQGAIFSCAACGRTYRNDDGVLSTIACETAEGEGEYLPFWCFAQTYRPGGPREPSLHVDLVDRRDAVTRFVYVPAFEPCPPTLSRRLSVLMTENQPPYATIPGAPERDPRCACAGTIRSARAVAALAVDEIESYDADASGSARMASFGDVEPTLLWVPFTTSQGFLGDPVSGVHLSEAVLEPGT